MRSPIPDIFSGDDFDFGDAYGPSRRAHRVDASEPAIPCNPEAERAVLSAMLQWPVETIPEIITCGGIGLFHEFAHLTLCEIILSLSDAAKPVDPVIITHELRSRNLLDAIGGPAVVAELQMEAPGLAGFEYWLRLLQEYRVRRELRQLSLETLHSIQEPEVDIESLLDRAESRILGVRGLLDQTQPRGLKETILQVIHDIEQRASPNESSTDLTTGWRGFDALSCGLRGGELILIAGATGTGKTILATNLVEHAAIVSGYPVGWFSLQESRQQTTARMMASMAGLNLGITGDAIVRQPLRSTSLMHAAAKLDKSQILIADTQPLSICQLRHLARRWKMKSDIRLLVLDCLHMVNSESRRGWNSFAAELSEIAAGLKALAIELNIPVVVFSALPGPPPEANVTRPTLQNPMGTLWPALDFMDVAACLWNRNGESTSEPVPCELHMLKHRRGPLGVVDLAFFPSRLRFEDASSD